MSYDQQPSAQRTADVPPERADGTPPEYPADPAPEPIVDAPVATAPEPTSELDVGAPGEPAATLWPPDTVRDYQEQWRDVQRRFVDDPRAASDEAESLVAQMLDQFSANLASRKRELDAWRGTEGADTEQLRMSVRGYGRLLERLLEV